jgi:hypothetical protein
MFELPGGLVKAGQPRQPKISKDFCGAFDFI